MQVPPLRHDVVEQTLNMSSQSGPVYVAGQEQTKRFRREMQDAPLRQGVD